MSSTSSSEEYASADENLDDFPSSLADEASCSRSKSSPAERLGLGHPPGLSDIELQTRRLSISDHDSDHGQGAELDNSTTPEKIQQSDEDSHHDEIADETGSSSPAVNPLAMRNLDSGTDVQLFKVYLIQDSVSGTEWVVDGEVAPDGGTESVWQEKRVKDSSTGEIISLSQLEHMLTNRVFGQFEAHRVKDLDTGRVIDLFEGIPRESVAESVRKELLVMDPATGQMLSLAELRKNLCSGPQGGTKKAKRRRLKLKSRNVKRMAAKLAIGIQAGMAGIQAGLEHVHELSSAWDSEAAGAGGGTAARAQSVSPVPGQVVKVQVHRKPYKELSQLQMLQELKAHTGLIWAMSFSACGGFLASGGQDKVVRVWAVRSGGGESSSPGSNRGGDGACTSSGRRASAGEPTIVGGDSLRPGTAGGPPLEELRRDVFRAEPYRQFSGHKSDVLDLAWSRSGFLLSSSMDRTVRMWHISVDGECLRVFRHTEFVTVVEFHPLNEMLFISGSIDGKVRLWDIPNVRVTDFADCSEMVTAAAFSPGGDKVVVGTLEGKCRFYNFSSRFSYEAQIDVGNRKTRSRKITGFQFVPGEPEKVLISSNDSRLRLYDLNEYQQRCKYKGHTNRSSQIRASFSKDGRYIICGSDQGFVYLWPTANPVIPAVNPSYTGFRKDKNQSYECFQLQEDIVTVALFGPESLRRHLSPSLSVASPPTRAASALLPSAWQWSPERGVLRVGNHSDLKQNEAREQDSAAAVPALREVLVAAGNEGSIKIFENTAPARWL